MKCEVYYLLGSIAYMLHALKTTEFSSVQMTLAKVFITYFSPDFI